MAAITAPSVEATGGRSLTGFETAIPVARRIESTEKRGIERGEDHTQVGEDPLGLRDPWTRTGVRCRDTR